MVSDQPRPDKPRRVYTDPDCDFCQQYRSSPYSMAPPHDASTRCKSGRRSHCSCDACF